MKYSQIYPFARWHDIALEITPPRAGGQWGGSGVEPACHQWSLTACNIFWRCKSTPSYVTWPAEHLQIQLNAVGKVHCTYLKSYNAEHSVKFRSHSYQIGHPKLTDSFDLHLFVLQLPVIKSVGYHSVFVVLTWTSNDHSTKKWGNNEYGQKVSEEISWSVLSTMFKQRC